MKLKNHIGMVLALSAAAFAGCTDDLRFHQLALHRLLNGKQAHFLHPFPEAFLHNVQFHIRF